MEEKEEQKPKLSKSAKKRQARRKARVNGEKVTEVTQDTWIPNLDSRLVVFLWDTSTIHVPAEFKDDLNGNMAKVLDKAGIDFDQIRIRMYHQSGVVNVSEFNPDGIAVINIPNPKFSEDVSMIEMRRDLFTVSTTYPNCKVRLILISNNEEFAKFLGILRRLDRSPILFSEMNRSSNLHNAASTVYRWTDFISSPTNGPQLPMLVLSSNGQIVQTNAKINLLFQLLEIVQNEELAATKENIIKVSKCFHDFKDVVHKMDIEDTLLVANKLGFVDRTFQLSCNVYFPEEKKSCGVFCPYDLFVWHSPDRADLADFSTESVLLVKQFLLETPIVQKHILELAYSIRQMYLPSYTVGSVICLLYALSNELNWFEGWPPVICWENVLKYTQHECNSNKDFASRASIEKDETKQKRDSCLIGSQLSDLDGTFHNISSNSVIIFLDLENCAIPGSFNLWHLKQRIAASLNLAEISTVDIRARIYTQHSIIKDDLKKKIRDTGDASLILLDNPNGFTEVVDKSIEGDMILAHTFLMTDIKKFADLHAGKKLTVCLVSADADYCRSLRHFKELEICVVLVTLPTAPVALIASADKVFQWPEFISFHPNIPMSIPEVSAIEIVSINRLYIVFKDLQQEEVLPSKLNITEWCKCSLTECIQNSEEILSGLETALKIGKVQGKKILYEKECTEVFFPSESYLWSFCAPSIIDTRAFKEDLIECTQSYFLSKEFPKGTSLLELAVLLQRNGVKAKVGVLVCLIQFLFEEWHWFTQLYGNNGNWDPIFVEASVKNWKRQLPPDLPSAEESPLVDPNSC